MYEQVYFKLLSELHIVRIKDTFIIGYFQI